MTDAARVYAVGREDVARWAATALSGDVVVIRESEDVARQPIGTVWLYPPSEAAALRALRPDDAVVVVRPATMPWSQLAHDVRSPVGVVSGALDELDAEGAMVALAQRGARQLAHHADCWYALGAAAPERVPVRLEEVARAALAELAALEPKRARRVEVSGEGRAETDPSRLRLGLVRLLSHALRATSQPVRVRVREAELVITAEDTLDLPTARGALDDPFGGSSFRLAMANALLGPLCAPSQCEDRILRLVLQRPSGAHGR